MRHKSSFLIFGIPIFIGAGLAIWWVSAAGSATLLRGLATANPVWVLAALSATAAWLFARFIRWQFLLRRVGVRLPIRTTLGTYVAGLPGTATPAYIGEAIRGMFIRRRFGVPLRISIVVLVLERLYDVMALALLTLGTALLGSQDNGFWQVAVAFLVLSAVGAAILWPLARRAGIRAEDIKVLRTPATIVPALTLSLFGWASAGLLFWFSSLAVGSVLGLVDGLRVFGTSTLLGALTLLPAGVGATGSIAILELAQLGFDTPTAVLIVTLVRLTGTGAAFALGGAFLLQELREAARGAGGPAEGAAHFDQIAEEYSAQ